MRISDWSSDVCSSDLLDRNEVERVHPVPGRGDEVTLLIANIPFDGDARVIIPAPGSPCRRDPLDRLWPANTLLNALRKHLIHPCQLSARFCPAKARFDR